MDEEERSKNTNANPSGSNTSSSRNSNRHEYEDPPTLFTQLRPRHPGSNTSSSRNSNQHEYEDPPTLFTQLRPRHPQSSSNPTNGRLGLNRRRQNLSVQPNSFNGTPNGNGDRSNDLNFLFASLQGSREHPGSVQLSDQHSYPNPYDDSHPNPYDGNTVRPNWNLNPPQRNNSNSSPTINAGAPSTPDWNHPLGQRLRNSTNPSHDFPHQPSTATSTRVQATDPQPQGYQSSIHSAQNQTISGPYQPSFGPPSVGANTATLNNFAPHNPQRAPAHVRGSRRRHQEPSPTQNTLTHGRGPARSTASSGTSSTRPIDGVSNNELIPIPYGHDHHDPLGLELGLAMYEEEMRAIDASMLLNNHSSTGESGNSTVGFQLVGEGTENQPFELIPDTGSGVGQSSSSGARRRNVGAAPNSPRRGNSIQHSRGTRTRRRAQDGSGRADNTNSSSSQVVSDEEFARRLQQEEYDRVVTPVQDPSRLEFLQAVHGALGGGMVGVNVGQQRGSRSHRNQRMQFSASAVQQPPPFDILQVLSTMPHNLVNRLFGEGTVQMLPMVPDGNNYEALLAMAEQVGVVSRGLTHQEINALPTRMHREKTSYTATPGGADTECSICLSEFEIGDLKIPLSCQHEFHKKCIEKWLGTNATCPICRKDIKES